MQAKSWDAGVGRETHGAKVNGALVGPIATAIPVSKVRRPGRDHRSARKPAARPVGSASRSSPDPANRTRLIFLILSSLMVCGLIGAAVATVIPANLLDDSDADDSQNAENLRDPNDDVIAEQQTAVAENPADVEELLLLANLYGNSSRLGDAIPIYEQVLSMAPQDASARLSFARALADGGMTADAELQFDRVLELEPESQPAHYYLAELLRLSTPPRTAEAIEHYRRAAAIDETTLISERSREQLATLGAASPQSGTASLSTPAPVEEATP